MSRTREEYIEIMERMSKISIDDMNSTSINMGLSTSMEFLKIIKDKDQEIKKLKKQLSGKNIMMDIFKIGADILYENILLDIPHEQIEEAMGIKDDWYDTIADVEELECSICMTNKIKVTYNCGHCSCILCCKKQKSCHICRKLIVNVRLVYL